MRVSGSSGRVCLNGIYVRETDNAYCFCPEGSTEDIWFPKSQCDLDNELAAPGTAASLWVPDWLLRKKGLS